MLFVDYISAGEKKRILLQWLPVLALDRDLGPADLWGSNPAGPKSQMVWLGTKETFYLDEAGLRMPCGQSTINTVSEAVFVRMR